MPEQFRKYAVRIGTEFDVKLHGLKARLFDGCGFGSKKATRKFLEWAEDYNPDLLWLHNIHGYYINIELLFNWIKSRPQMKVNWHLHDCWAFTGHCTYFSMVGCDKWKKQCNNCPQKKEYPVSFLLDRSEYNYEIKKKLFSNVNNMLLITPSKWLADLTRNSFLKNYPVEVRYNTIDTSIFKPTKSDFREKNGLEEKIIILGVASVWEKRKGLEDFCKLATMLDDRFIIVLVGLSKRQIDMLPENIIGIKRTESPQELAAIYTASDVFVNPSKEETFGMTTLEASNCGLKVIVYEGTACGEIAVANGGSVVRQGAENIYNAITKQFAKS